jgi:hypothetical protein
MAMTRAALGVPVLFFCTMTFARAMPPAYERVAADAGVPAVVLFAVALQESGMAFRGRLVPWPWTLNVAGAPERYPSRTRACAGLKRALARGVAARRIDVGLTQINLGYHGAGYRNPCDLLDPAHNITVAAGLLRGHHTPGEDWLTAIGRYHRPRGGAPAARYRQNIKRHLKTLTRGRTS